MFADLLIHVTDISNPLAAEAAEVVDGVLDDLGLGETPRVLVLNKLDLVTKERPPGDEVSDDGAVMTSAIKRWGIDELRFAIDAALNTDNGEVAVEGSTNGAVV